ncbi:MAG TPA: hypothetical protein VF186_07375 [Gaiellaceae bacterium]|jgi:hypothetical protein
MTGEAAVSWRALDELAEREEAAVAGRRWNDLLLIQAERRAVLDALPASLPAEARPTFERALARAEQTRGTLMAGLAETKSAIERLRGGRRVVGAYKRAGT